MPTGTWEFLTAGLLLLNVGIDAAILAARDWKSGLHDLAFLGQLEADTKASFFERLGPKGISLFRNRSKAT